MGGFKKGDRVQLITYGGPIPELRTIGTVLGFQGDDEVVVKFPQGTHTWDFPPEQLRPAEVNV